MLESLAKDLTSLHGRLHFAEGQLFGRRCFKRMKVISDRASNERPGHVDEELKQALTHMRDRVIQGRPRDVRSRLANVWHVFTDACSEPGRSCAECGTGCVLISSVGKQLLTPFCAAELANPIYLLERLAFAAALDLWTGLLEGSELVCFIDNEGVLGSLTSCKASAAYFEPILDFIAGRRRSLFAPGMRGSPARQTLQTAPS